MQSLLQLGEAIERRVIARHAETITRFLDILEINISDAQTAAQKCSYEAYLTHYVQTKLKVRYMGRDLEREHDLPTVPRPYDSEGAMYDRIVQRINILSCELDKIHDNMYRNVCGKCSSCHSRRKHWPAGTEIQNSIPIQIAGDFFLMMQPWSDKPGVGEFNVHSVGGCAYINGVSMGEHDGQASD